MRQNRVLRTDKLANRTEPELTLLVISISQRIG